MKYIIAHDLGTSGNKATLFDEDGRMVTSETFAYGCHYFNTNWAEQNPEDWWQAICETSRNLIIGGASSVEQLEKSLCCTEWESAKRRWCVSIRF